MCLEYGILRAMFKVLLQVLGEIFDVLRFVDLVIRPCEVIMVRVVT